MNLQPKKYLKSFYWRDYLYILVGLILYAVGLTAFLIPNKVVTGGLGGVSLLIKYSTGIPIFVSYFTINLLLLVLRSEESSVEQEGRSRCAPYH